MNVPRALTDAIDRVVDSVTSAIQQAADSSIPKAKPCERSKPWWSKELAALRKSSSKAFCHQQSHPSLNNQRKARKKRSSYLKAIKAAKVEHWNQFLQKAQGKDVFKAMQYTKERTTRVIPPLQYKQGQETLVAEDFKEQCTAFRTTLFSSPPSTRVSLDWKGYSADRS